MNRSLGASLERVVYSVGEGPLEQVTSSGGDARKLHGGRVWKGPSVRDDDVKDELLTVAAADERGGVNRRTLPGWNSPAGSQGCSRRTLGAFDARRLNPPSTMRSEGATRVFDGAGCE